MDNKSSPAKLLIDFKQYRIRIYKSTLHELGNPVFIKFLINPETKVLAVKAYSYEVSGDQTYRIKPQRYFDKQCVEIKCRSLVCSFSDIVPDFEHNHGYLLQGSIIESENMAVFPLSNVTSIN